MSETETSDGYAKYRAVIEFADEDTMRTITIHSEWVDHRWKAESLVEYFGPYGDEWDEAVDGYVEGRDRLAASD